MKRNVIVTVLILFFYFFVFSQIAGAFLNNAKVTIIVVDDAGKPLEGADAGVGFETNANFSTKTFAKRGLTDENGRFAASGNCDGHIGYGARKEGYYSSHYEYNFQKRGVSGWEPWNQELTILLRKIENPKPMYARDIKFSKIKIPVVGKNIGFDLIRCDWVAPYGRGEYADFLINLASMVESVKNYNFTVAIKFDGYNGAFGYVEDIKNGSQFKLPRFAPETGYENILKIYDRTEKGKNRDVSWKDNHHYIFRVRSIVDKYNKLEKAMYGKIIGDIHLGPQRDGTAYIEFKYYLNPDYTRNLEFDPKRNLFGNLPDLEQVNEP